MDLACGGISVLLNLNNTKTIYNLADDILNNRFNDTKDYVVSYSDYIDILPSCKDPRQGNKIDLKLIEQIISLYKNNYDLLRRYYHLLTFWILLIPYILLAKLPSQE